MAANKKWDKFGNNLGRTVYGDRNAGGKGGGKSSAMDDLEAIEKVMPINDKFKNDYVDIAHDIMTDLGTKKVITKTKIRSIYNMLCDIIDNEKHSVEA